MRKLQSWLPAIILSFSILFAQGDRGSITGVVTDPTGAVMPHAAVMAVNSSTGIRTATSTGDAGAYTMPFLPIGSYTVTVEMQGFKTYSREVPVQVGQTTRIDVTLEVGAAQEKVTVSAEAPLLTTETSDVGVVVNNQKFLELPLTLGGDIRNPSSFIFLSPGVAGDTWEKHIGGGGSFSDAVYYDGGVLSGPSSQNDGQYNPSVDAIAEFKLISDDYSAEYGHALAGVTSFTLKSGTNSLHGSAFEFFRNEKMDARGFFATSKAPTRQNEFGGTIGGPIRKNGTFIFFSIDSFRRRQGSTPSVLTVPLPEFLRGDFSKWTSAIYDPATTRPAPSGGFMRDAFAGNQIPASRFSKISQNIAALLPGPTIASRLTNNYVAPLTSPLQDDHNFSLKLDHQITEKHQLFGTFIFSDRPAIKGQAAGVTGPAEDHNRQDLDSRMLRVGEDWTITPATLNHLLLNFNRIISKNYSVTFGKGWPAKLGLTGVVGDLFPAVMFNQGYPQLGDTIAGTDLSNAFGGQDTLSVTRGKHSIKTGFEYLRRRNNSLALANSAGTYNFSNLETARPGDSSTGNSVASFLLGTVDSGNALFPSTELGQRWSYISLFFQDDYKVTSKLTLNLGMRWELQTPFSDALNRFSYMDPSLPNPGAGNRPGAISFAGPKLNGWTRLADPDYRNFGPRVGFAYSFAPNWVLRSGYGIFYWNVSGAGIGFPADGFNTTASFASGDVGVTPAFTWDSGFPQDFQKPPVTSPTVDNGQNATVSVRSRGGAWPYTQQWNMTLERQIGSTMSVRAAYVGVKGTRLHAQDATNWNQVNPQYLALGSLLSAQITSPQAVATGLTQPFPGFGALWGNRATVAQSLRPFPQYGSIGQAAATYGNSNYHSLQIFLQKRMKQGFDLTAAYTFSKMIDDTRQFSSGVGQQNYFDRRAERSISVSDQPQILSLSYVYQLPFGPGRRLLGSSHGVLSKLAGGWTVSGIQRYASGLPLSLSATNTLPIFNGLLRPSVVAGVPVQQAFGSGGFDPARDRWINPAAFRIPAAFTFGNSARYLSYLRGPGTLAESFGVIKDTKLTERVKWQFRFELSNPFNRTVFSSPLTNLSALNFGQITSQGNSPRSIQLGMKLIW